MVENAGTLGSPWAAARMGVGARARRITAGACAKPKRYVRGKTGQPRHGRRPDPIRSRAPTAAERWRRAIAGDERAEPDEIPLSY